MPFFRKTYTCHQAYISCSCNCYLHLFLRSSLICVLLPLYLQQAGPSCVLLPVCMYSSAAVSPLLLQPQQPPEFAQRPLSNCRSVVAARRRLVKQACQIRLAFYIIPPEISSVGIVSFPRFISGIVNDHRTLPALLTLLHRIDPFPDTIIIIHVRHIGKAVIAKRQKGDRPLTGDV